MNILGFTSRFVRAFRNNDFLPHGALLILGSFLVLFSLTMPWPCLPGSRFEEECSPALHSLVFNEWQVGLFLGLFVLLMLLSAKFNRIPINYLAWGSFWLIYFDMVYVRWVPFDMGGAFPGTYFTAFSINTGLPGITPTVLPLSLAAFWLAMRPDALRRKTRWLAIAILVLLLLFTLFFFVFEIIRIFTRAQIPNDDLDVFLFGLQGIFGAAPLLILIGAAVLLGEEIAALRQARSQAAAQPAPAGPPVQLNRSQKYLLAGFWAAIVLAAEPFFMELGFVLPNSKDPVLYFLASFLRSVAGPLQVIALLVLILALMQVSSPGKKVFLKISLGLAILFAGLILLEYVAPIQISAINFKIAQAVNLDDHGFLLTSIISCLMSLALLFTLPAYQKKGFQRAIRWLLIINALVAIPTVVFVDFSRNQQNIAMIASLLKEFIILPAVAILLTVFFRRASRSSITTEVAAPAQDLAS